MQCQAANSFLICKFITVEVLSNNLSSVTGAPDDVEPADGGAPLDQAEGGDPPDVALPDPAVGVPPALPPPELSSVKACLALFGRATHGPDSTNGDGNCLFTAVKQAVYLSDPARTIGAVRTIVASAEYRGYAADILDANWGVFGSYALTLARNALRPECTREAYLEGVRQPVPEGRSGS